MNSTLEVIIAILQEAGVDYYLMDDTGFNYLVEIPSKKNDEFRPVKIMCGFKGPLFEGLMTPTGILVHVCSSFECCPQKWTVLPVQGNTFHGVLEDPDFYNDLVELVNSVKEGEL